MTHPPATPTTSDEPRVATAVQALRLMHDLGDSAATVAASLAKLGIRGAECSTGRCPIAVHLRSNLDVYEVSVVGDVVYLKFSERDGDGEFVNTTEAVEQFILGFDHGQHKELVLGSDVALAGGPS